MSQKDLIGKTLTGLKIAADKHAIMFETTAGNVVVRTYGDCCSHTWVEHIELPALGFPALVTAVDDLELNKPPVENDEYEYLQFYGCKVSTDRGEIVIDYRNSSNGYYGGNLEWDDIEDGYDGVFNQNKCGFEWKPVSESTGDSLK